MLGAVLWYGAGMDADWLAMHGLQRLQKLALLVAAGALAYFATLALLGFRLRDFQRRG